MPNSIKVAFISLILLSGVSGVLYAQEEPGDTAAGYSQAVTEAINLDENVQPQDLGVGEPRILPGSPLYFLKNLSRGIQGLLTFGPVKKAELKLKFANEKLMEAKKLVELGKDPEIIKRGIENYQGEIGRVEKATQNITEKAKDNEEIESFFDVFLFQQTLHQKLLQKLENQVPQQAFEKIKEARENHLEKFAEIMTRLEDRPQKIEEKLTENLDGIKGSQYKNFKNLEVLMNLEEKVPQQAQEAIQGAQENALKRLQEDIEKMSPDDQEKFKEYIERIGGQKEKHLEILENLKSEIGIMPETSRASEVKKLLERERIKILEEMENKLEQFNCPVWTTSGSEFCKEGRVIVERNPQTNCYLPPKCIMTGEILSGGLITCCVDKSCVRVTQDKCEGAGGKIVTAPSCIPNPCEGALESPEKPPETGACITLWNPVCGQDGKTYSNACFAKTAGIEINYEGICEEGPDLTETVRCCTDRITCITVTRKKCYEAMGWPVSAKSCFPNPCKELVICCQDSACALGSKDGCSKVGGRVVEANSCTPNPCETKEIEIPQKTPIACIQVITPAMSPDGVCKEFSTPCDIPEEWQKVDKCPAEVFPEIITCCVNEVCTRVTKEKCEGAGGRVDSAPSCYPDPCKQRVQETLTPLKVIEGTTVTSGVGLTTLAEGNPINFRVLVAKSRFDKKIASEVPEGERDDVSFSFFYKTGGRILEILGARGSSESLFELPVPKLTEDGFLCVRLQGGKLGAMKTYGTNCVFKFFFGKYPDVTFTDEFKPEECDCSEP